MWGAKRGALDSSFTKRSFGGGTASGGAPKEIRADFGIDDSDYRYLGIDVGEIQEQKQKQQAGKRKVGFVDDDEEEEQPFELAPAQPEQKKAAKEPNPFEGWRFKMELYRTSSLLRPLDHATLSAIRTLLTSRNIRLTPAVRQELQNESNRPDESKQRNPIIVVKRDVDTGKFNLFMREVVSIMDFTMACALGCTYDISSTLRNVKFGQGESLHPFKGEEKAEHGQKFGIVDAVNEKLNNQLSPEDADNFDWQVKGYFYARGELSSEEVCQQDVFQELLDDVKAILSKEKVVLERLPERVKGEADF